MKWFLTIFLSFSLIFLVIFANNCFFGYFYPIRYQNEISLASEQSGLDKKIIYSVINIESRFNKDALSAKGAIGLMQILPTTAKEVAESIDLKDYDIKDPETNILLGSLYLKKMIDIFENTSTAVCAYNAGPTKVRSWLEDERYSQDGVTLSKIPFDETRNYLSKFNKNYKYYSKKIK